MKGERHLLGDERIELIDLLPGVFQVESAVHHLDPQMIFLVDHQADLFVAVDRDAAGSLAFGVLAADQLALDQKLTVDDLQLVDVEVLQFARLFDSHHAIAQDRFDVAAIGRAGAADEGEIGQVSCQANAAGNDDVALGSGSPQPLAARSC